MHGGPLEPIVVTFQSCARTTARRVRFHGLYLWLKRRRWAPLQPDVLCLGKAAIVNGVVAYSDQFGDPPRVSGNVRRSRKGYVRSFLKKHALAIIFAAGLSQGGRAVPITAAPDGVESFQELRPGA